MQIKQGISMPYEYQIKEKADDTGDPVDLTNAESIVMNATKYEDTTPTITVTCEFVDRLLGLISIPWTSAQTSVLGMYRVEFTITWAGGKIEKVPSDTELWLLITSSNTP